MNNLPVAAVIIDAKFHKGIVRECKNLNIPVVGLVDTNTDPDIAEYIIPSNDDAIKSIRLIVKTLADAVKEGNKGKEIIHRLKDYSNEEIKIIKGRDEEDESEASSAISVGSSDSSAPVSNSTTSKLKTKRSKSKGILEQVQKDKEKK
ncbi:MAG: 30S ribosomal protein S2 [Candidatus Dojkabacteria bacterium]|nr:30S ribosomal protein S2 [Candidatus Dojkabacteria bacterium]